jgi:hypothetical protein
MNPVNTKIQSMNPQHQKADIKIHSMNDNEPTVLDGRYSQSNYVLFMFSFILSIHVLKVPVFVSSLISAQIVPFWLSI